MQLGDILIAKGLISQDELVRAIEHQRDNGGRLGNSVAAIGALSAEAIEEVLQESPSMPMTIEQSGISTSSLLQLLFKGIYSENLDVPNKMSTSLKLPLGIINTLLKEGVDRKLLETLGQDLSSPAGGLAEMRYGLTVSGKDWAVQCMEQSQYFGPAPVSLAEFTDRIQRQKITNEWVSHDMMKEAFKDLVIDERFVSRLGPAVNSGAAILIYGPAGNGKTTIAEIIGGIFQNVVYIPYCFEVDGQIIKVFDPSVHIKIDHATEKSGSKPSLRRERFDPRWVACYRPMVVTGGELTLEMLDLKYNETSKFYEAPLHIKALNGTFLIDDFGRQKADPSDILNRWIVPLNSRIDFLTLHTGKSFEIPFDEMVIFSTNLHPNDLMDPAFQRRIAFKLETLEPAEDLFKSVFEGMAASKGLDLTDEHFNQVVNAIRAAEQPLAYFQPKFIIEQVLFYCKFVDITPVFTRENIEDALANLIITSSDAKMFGVAKGQ